MDFYKLLLAALITCGGTWFCEFNISIKREKGNNNQQQQKQQQQPTTHKV